MSDNPAGKYRRININCCTGGSGVVKSVKIVIHIINNGIRHWISVCCLILKKSKAVRISIRMYNELPGLSRIIFNLNKKCNFSVLITEISDIVESIPPLWWKWTFSYLYLFCRYSKHSSSKSSPRIISIFLLGW